MFLWSQQVPPLVAVDDRGRGRGRVIGGRRARLAPERFRRVVDEQQEDDRAEDHEHVGLDDDAVHRVWAEM